MLSSNKDLLTILEENGQKLVNINRHIQEAVNQELVGDKNRYDELLAAIRERMKYIQDTIALIENFESEYLSLKQWLDAVSTKIADKNNVGIDSQALETLLTVQQVSRSF